MPPPVSVPMPNLAKVLWPLTAVNRAPLPPREPQRRGIDVGAVITRALTAAGLMK
jgi:feruloyl esterase